MTAQEQLALAYLEGHAPHASRTLERLPTVQAAMVLRRVPGPTGAAVMREMTSSRAAECLAQLRAEEAGAILAGMPADIAAGIVRALAPASRDAALAAMPAVAREPLVRVLPFPEGTAGAVMDPSIFQVRDDTMIAEARTRLRHAARELLYYVYVVDREGRLVGVLDIPELMLAAARARVHAAMHREPERLSAWMPVALVREHPAWQRYHAMPVVDDVGRLLGAIRYQTLRRLERELAGRTADPMLLTVDALGDLFRVSTVGLVAGVAAVTAGEGSRGG